MFRGVGRRLALFNAVIVIALVALTGTATYLLLLRQLGAEMDEELQSSAKQTVSFVRTLQPTSTADAHDSAKDDDDEHKRHDDEILGSGDTIIFAVNSSGAVIYNPRDITMPGVPDPASIKRALAGEDDLRSLTFAGIGPVRVVSLPVENDHQVVGAVQVFRSLREHNAELATVRWITLLGVAFGAAIAVPAGLLLARRAMRPIDAAFARQRAFVADASHELRTPLTLIRANAEIARAETTAPVSSIEPELTSILEEVDRTDNLIDDLLTLARADAGRLELYREMLDLTLLAREVYTDMLPMARQRGIELKIDASTPCVTLIDANYFRQALRIVLNNALKYTPAGRSATLTVSPGADRIRVVVQDTGEGIPAEHLPHLFDRFYRVDKSRSRAAGGTGLGLPIARTLVEAQGGLIDLASTVGRGTTVMISFPRQESSVLTPQAPRRPRW